MAKPKLKESRTTSFSLDVRVLNKLDEYHKKTFVPKTRIIEQAVMEYLDKMEERESKINKIED